MNRFIEILLSQSRQVDIARTAIILLLLTMIAKPVAEITWKIIPFGKSNDKTFAISKKNAAMPGEKATVIGRPGDAGVQKSAAEYHLFGQAGRVTIEPVLETIQNVPKTSLNLVLKGVIVASPMDKALAVINDKKGNNEDEVYGVGDKVFGVAELREIYADRVILLHSGRLETLMLVDADTIELGQSTSIGSDNITSQGDGLHWVINSGYWNRQINDIPALASQIGVDIYRENNVQKGFKLLSSRGNKLLSDLGLQPGDVLYEVEGIKLTNAHNGLMAYQKIKSASQVTLKVGRDGRMMTRIYSIK